MTPSPAAHPDTPASRAAMRWWIELPVWLAGTWPRLASAFTDGQYLLRYPRLAGLLPFAALGYGVAVEWAQTSEVFSSQLWVVIALSTVGLIAVQLGALAMLGYCAMDLIAGRDFATGPFRVSSEIPSPIDTWISIGVEYLLIAIGMVGLPMVINELRVVMRRRNVVGLAGPSAEYLLHGLAAAVGYLAWCHTIVTSIRTVYTIKGATPPAPTVFTAQEQWRHVVTAAVGITAIRWILEWALFSSRLLDAISETTPRLASAATTAKRRPGLRRLLTAVAITMLLGGIIDYWWQTVVSLVLVAAMPVLAGRFATTFAGRKLAGLPRAARIAFAMLASWAIVWQVADLSLHHASSGAAANDFRLAFVGAMATIIVVHIALAGPPDCTTSGTAPRRRLPSPPRPTTATALILIVAVSVSLIAATAGSAYADNCSELSDCFETQKSMIVALGLLLLVVGVGLMLSPMAVPLLGTGFTIGAAASIPPGALIAGTGAAIVLGAEYRDDVTAAFSQIDLPGLSTQAASRDTPFANSDEWEDGPKPPDPLQAEIDNIAEHGWAGHVQPALDDPLEPIEFPEVGSMEDFKDAIGDAIDHATDWGYRRDGSVYWYDEVTNTIVIKNPNGQGTAYRPRIDRSNGN